jgi:hypothetical protein
MKIVELTDNYVIDMGKLSEQRFAYLLSQRNGIKLLESGELEQYQNFFNSYDDQSVSDLQIGQQYFPLEITASPAQKVISIYTVTHAVKLAKITEAQLIFKNDHQEKAIAFPNNLLDSEDHAVWVFSNKNTLDSLISYATLAFKNNWILSVYAYDEHGQLRNTKLSN